MADFKLKKRVDFTFALEGDEETVYTLPSIQSLSFEAAKAMASIDEEADLVKKGGMIRDFILKSVPALGDKGLGDMEYLEIFNAYAMHAGRSLGELKASQPSSKSTARQ